MTSSTTINHDQAKALAAFINTLRPDWDVHGVVAAIGRARDRGDAQQTAHAAIRAACTASNRTPAIIGMDGPHWRVSKPESSGPPLPPPFCRRCHRPHPTDTGCDADDIGGTGDPDRRARLIAEVKAAAGADCRRCADPRSRCVAHQPVRQPVEAPQTARPHVEAPQTSVQPEAVPVGPA